MNILLVRQNTVVINTNLLFFTKSVYHFTLHSYYAVADRGLRGSLMVNPIQPPHAKDNIKIEYNLLTSTLFFVIRLFCIRVLFGQVVLNAGSIRPLLIYWLFCETKVTGVIFKLYVLSIVQFSFNPLAYVTLVIKKRRKYIFNLGAVKLQVCEIHLGNTFLLHNFFLY